MASLVQRPGSSLWYLQFYVSGKLKRRSTGTALLQIAKEKLREFESAQARGENPLFTRTPIAEIVTAYVSHIRTKKTAKSAQTDIYYLRDLFGPICDALKITSRKISAKSKKRPPKEGQDRRRREIVIEASCFEKITPTQISEFISARMRSRGLAPKTANRYREILVRLFNWATDERGVKLVGGINPAKKVQRYEEAAPVIRYLTLEQIESQLDALSDNVQMQAMVATMIYAGLRREEMLWLTFDDLDLTASNHGVIRVQAKRVGEEFWQPKTRSNRVVPVSSRLRHYLDKWRLKASGRGWLFPNSAKGRYDPDNFSSDLRAANAAKGYTWTNLHFRHTFGSMLAQGGVSLFQIAKLMGNSPQIAERHYAAMDTKDLSDKVEFQPASPAIHPQPAAASV